MELKNYMEDYVWQMLDEVLESNPSVCECEQCRFDIAALALNCLPPRYVVTTRGETFARIKSSEHQFSIDVVTAITNAIKIVSKQPHHYEGKD